MAIPIQGPEMTVSTDNHSHYQSADLVIVSAFCDGGIIRIIGVVVVGTIL